MHRLSFQLGVPPRPSPQPAYAVDFCATRLSGRLRRDIERSGPRQSLGANELRFGGGDRDGKQGKRAWRAGENIITALLLIAGALLALALFVAGALWRGGSSSPRQKISILTPEDKNRS